MHHLRNSQRSYPVFLRLEIPQKARHIGPLVGLSPKNLAGLAGAGTCIFSFVVRRKFAERSGGGERSYALAAVGSRRFMK